jgi:hypothetical protein
MAATQTYANHRRVFPVYHFFILPVLLAHVINQIRYFWRAPSEGAAFAVLVAVALLVFAMVARTMVLTVQNRLIRLEMQIRLRSVLPPDLASRIHELTVPQLIALRFASDAELAAIVRDTLAGQLTGQTAIKKRISDWQADTLRA